MQWSKKAFDWLKSNETLYLTLLSVPVGLLAGYGALAIRFGIEQVSVFWTGNKAWEMSIGSLPWYIYIIAPVSTGLIVGWLTQYLMPHGELRGVPGVLGDLTEGRGVNRKQMATETFGTVISVGSGASLGREGPTVALGAVLASEIGFRLGLAENQLRTLIGCGVAAGIAASFNTPIAGVLFALEVILADYALTTFSPIVISAVIATVITRSTLGNFPAFAIPQYQLVSSWEISFHMIIGITCGLIAAILIKSMAPVRRLLRRWIVKPQYRPAAAGLAVGLIGLFVPQAMSIGYGTVESFLLEEINPEIMGMMLPVTVFLAAVLVCKLAVTIISAAGDFPGGLLGPSLFLGAATGALFGGVAHGISPEYSETLGGYALVACGALTAAALQAPITVIMMVFELTSDYEIMLPLMAACIVATLVKRAFGRESVFTERLQEEGIETGWGLERSWLRAFKVDKIPRKDIPSVSESASLRELKEVYVASGKGCVQIEDKEGLMVGIVTFADLQKWLLDSSLDDIVVASEVANRNVLCVSQDSSLLEAIRVLDRETFEQMPVMARDNPRKMLGVLSRNAVFSTYHRLIVEHGERSGG